MATINPEVVGLAIDTMADLIQQGEGVKDSAWRAVLRNTRAPNPKYPMQARIREERQGTLYRLLLESWNDVTLEASY